MRDIVFLLNSMRSFKSEIMHVILWVKEVNCWQYITVLIPGLKDDWNFCLEFILLPDGGIDLEWSVGTQQVLKSGHTFVLPSPSVRTIPNVHKLSVWIIEFYSLLTINMYTDSLQFAEPVHECNRYCQFGS